jgi:hypothetical protein
LHEENEKKKKIVEEYIYVKKCKKGCVFYAKNVEGDVTLHENVMYLHEP